MVSIDPNKPMLSGSHCLRINNREATEEKDADHLKHLHDSIPVWPAYSQPRHFLDFGSD